MELGKTSIIKQLRINAVMDKNVAIVLSDSHIDKYLLVGIFDLHGLHVFGWLIFSSNGKANVLQPE